jgi:hypothetical protein
MEGEIMKTNRILLIALLIGGLLYSCASGPDTGGGAAARTLSSSQDVGGNLSIGNESGQDLILYINGEANRRIPSKIDQLFRVKMTEEMALNNNQTVQIRLYPIGIFGDNLELTPDNRDRTVFVQQVRHTDLVEFQVPKENVDEILASAQPVKFTQTEFDIYLPSGARDVLVELYTNEACTVRLAQGSVRPGETLKVFRNPAEQSEITIYAKYIRNDGKSDEELGRGKIVSGLIVTGDGIPIDVALPSDYRNLDGPISGPSSTRPTTATLIIENTRPIDRARNNNVIVYLDNPSTRIERHADVRANTNSSLIGPRTKQTYVITPSNDGKDYRIFINDFAEGTEIATYDYRVNLGETYTITVPGSKPASIPSADSVLDGITRRVNFTSNEPDVEISFKLDSPLRNITIGSNSFTLIGKTDTTSRHALTGRVDPLVTDLTYNMSGSVKILFQATKDGFITQTKSVNFQAFIDAENGYTVEAFEMVKSDF